MDDENPETKEYIFFDVELYVPIKDRISDNRPLAANPYKQNHSLLRGVFCRLFPLKNNKIDLEPFWIWNDGQERINGEIRDRGKVMRGLKKTDTPILKGYQIYHNFIRGHEGLDGKTPAEACGIKVEGENKWITLIQNASQQEHQRNNGAQ